MQQNPVMTSDDEFYVMKSDDATTAINIGASDGRVAIWGHIRSNVDGDTYYFPGPDEANRLLIDPESIAQLDRNAPSAIALRGATFFQPRPFMMLVSGRDDLQFQVGVDHEDGPEVVMGVNMPWDVMDRFLRVSVPLSLPEDRRLDSPDGP